MALPKVMTAEEFEAYALLPENADRRLEWFEGEVVELVSSNRTSFTAMLLGSVVTVFVQQHRLGFVTGADGGYRVGRHRFIPDVAFVSRERQPAPSDDAYNPIASDLAVEVKSPTDRLRRLRRKVLRYLEAGTRLVWLVFPETQTVEVYRPGQEVITLTAADTLDGGDVLPGFALKVADIFGA